MSNSYGVDNAISKVPQYLKEDQALNSIDLDGEIAEEDWMVL